MLLIPVFPLRHVILSLIYYSTITLAAVANCWKPDPHSIDHPPPADVTSCIGQLIFPAVALDGNCRFLNPPVLPQPIRPPAPAPGTRIIRGYLQQDTTSGDHTCRLNVGLGAVPYVEPEDLYADVPGQNIWDAIKVVLDTCVKNETGPHAGWTTVEPENKVHLILRGLPDGPVGPPVAAEKVE